MPLTEEQTTRLAEFRDRWTAIGLSTAPADRDDARRAIRAMYRAAGLIPARSIMWCGSPREMFATVGAKELTKSVKDRLWHGLGASIWQGLRSKVDIGTVEHLKKVTGLVVEEIWGRIGWHIRRSFPNVTFALHGHHDAGAMIFYDFLGAVCGIRNETAKLAGLIAYSQSAGWSVPTKDACWICERPSVLTRDIRGRLHSLTGPALAYPDGWGIHAVHGIRVDPALIENSGVITIQSIEVEPNVEIRRVMITLYGPVRYLHDVGAKLVNQSSRGKLWRVERKGDSPLVMVEVENSTPEPDGSRKTYWLRVPPHIRTAAAAVAWRFGFEVVRDYHPQIET